MSIRSKYEKYGVENYYKSTPNYVNEHEQYVKQLIIDNHQTLPLSSVLDLSAGTGLVTTTLQLLGYSNIEGTDPFLYEQYTETTRCVCYPYDFKYIVQNGIEKTYSCIICSFALHLCEKSLLPRLMYRLSECTDKLVVISPSKFPIIKMPAVEKFSLTSAGKRVHYKEYNIKGSL